jgi:hypothetical protein
VRNPSPRTSAACSRCRRTPSGRFASPIPWRPTGSGPTSRNGAFHGRRTTCAKRVPAGRTSPSAASIRNSTAGVNSADPSRSRSSPAPKARETYIARIQKRVGFAKGSWLNAGKAIGGRIRGAVQWATRHKQSPGSATIKTGDNPAVTLVNKLDYIEDVSTRKGIKLALQVAAGRLRKALATSLRKINDGANRSLRRRSG